MDFWHTIKHFKPHEFDDPDLPGSHVYMDPLTIIMLDQLRAQIDWPIITHNKFEVRGCVCMSGGHHSPQSYHNYDNPHGCSAVDFHFGTRAPLRQQAHAVLQSGFSGIGIYQGCWQWPGKWADPDGYLPIGFHADRRKYCQVWKYENGEYVYLLK